MAEYKECEVLKKYIRQYTPNINGETTIQCVERAIDEAPIADVVEVVRCKQCCYFMKYTADDIAEGIDAEGADGRCFIRVVNSKDNQFCAVKNDDFCSKVKPLKGE